MRESEREREGRETGRGREKSRSGGKFVLGFRALLSKAFNGPRA